MSEMIERVAEAIRKSEAYWWNRDDEPDDGLAETLARAAIHEMREPTKAMIDAAYKAHDEFESKPESAWCGLSSAYRAMINEALSPPHLDYDALEKNRLAIEETRRASAMIEDEASRAKNCTFGNPDCPTCNPPKGAIT